MKGEAVVEPIEDRDELREKVLALAVWIAVLFILYLGIRGRARKAQDRAEWANTRVDWLNRDVSNLQGILHGFDLGSRRVRNDDEHQDVKEPAADD